MSGTLLDDSDSSDDDVGDDDDSDDADDWDSDLDEDFSDPFGIVDSDDEPGIGDLGDLSGALSADEEDDPVDQVSPNLSGSDQNIALATAPPIGDPDVVPTTSMSPDASLSLGLLDSAAPVSFSLPFDPSNPFPDLALNFTADNFNYQSAMLLGIAILGGLPLSLPPGSSTDLASNLSLSNWLTGVGQAWEMTAQWMVGEAPAWSVYGPDSQQTQDMMSAPGVQNALNYFYDKNTGLSLDQQQPVTNYNPGFGLGGLLAAQLNPTQQFVGDYRLDLYPQADGTILIIASNTTSETSLYYGKYPAAWNAPTGVPMGNASQIYVWTVPNQTMQEPIPPSSGGASGTW